jgi:hypothetical protein
MEPQKHQPPKEYSPTGTGQTASGVIIHELEKSTLADETKSEIAKIGPIYQRDILRTREDRHLRRKRKW